VPQFWQNLPPSTLLVPQLAQNAIASNHVYNQWERHTQRGRGEEGSEERENVRARAKRERERAKRERERACARERANGRANERANERAMKRMSAREIGRAPSNHGLHTL
jgi:hypothetical protein